MERADILAIRILATAYEQLDSQKGWYGRRKLARAIQFLRNGGFRNVKNRTYRTNRKEDKNLWA